METVEPKPPSVLRIIFSEEFWRGKTVVPGWIKYPAMVIAAAGIVLNVLAAFDPTLEGAAKFSVLACTHVFAVLCVLETYIRVTRVKERWAMEHSAQQSLVPAATYRP